MSTNNTSYQVTKTVRFKLEAVNQAELPRIKANLLKIKNGSSDKEVSLETIINQKKTIDLNELNLVGRHLNEIIDLVKSLIFVTYYNGRIDNNHWSNLYIKYGFLKNYFTTDFYTFKERVYPRQSYTKPPKRYKLNDENLQFFRDAITGQNGLIERLKKISNKIEYFKFINQSNKTLFADIALVLGNINKRNNLKFLKDLVNSLVVPYNDFSGNDLIKDNLNKKIQDFEILVNGRLTYYAPFNPSIGFQTRGGSFNYFVFDKNEMILEEKGKELRKKLTEIYKNKDITILSSLNITYEVFVDFYTSLRKLTDKYINKSYQEVRADIIKQYNLKDKNLKQVLQLNMEEMYKFIRLWKSKQKMDYMNALMTYYSDNVAKEFVDNSVLFNNQKSVDKLKEMEHHLQMLYNEIDNYNTTDERKQALMVEIQNTKVAISKINKKSVSKNYIKLCDYYNKLAFEYNGIKNRLTNIEKEKAAASCLVYWCIIIENDKGEQFLYLIPKKHVQEVYKNINHTSISAQRSGVSKLYYLESLTLKALRIMCFKENSNTIRRQLPKFFPNNEQYKIGNEYGQQYRIGNEYRHDYLIKEKNTIQERISIFQKALRILINNGTISIDENAEVVSKSYNTLDDFEFELNKSCYKKTFIYVKKSYADTLIRYYNAIRFKITSKDLGKDKVGCFPTEIWKHFWHPTNMVNNYPIRLNPEVKLYWRAAKPSRLVKYMNNEKRSQNFKNRYCGEQFTVAFTMTENALSLKPNYIFAVAKKQEPDVIKNYDAQANIDCFNDELNNKSDFRFSIGIDTGTKGRAFIFAGIVDVNKKPITINVLKIKDSADHNKLKYSKTNGRTKDYFYADNYATKLFCNKDLYNEVFDDGKFEETSQLFIDGKVKDAYKKDFKTGKQIRRVIENPSYFLNKSLYDKTFGDGKYIETKNDIFEKKEVAAIDMTTAKVINGEIVLNADLTTYQTLNFLCAKHKLCRELNVRSNPKIEKRDDAIYLVDTNEQQEVCLYRKIEDEYNFALSYDDIFTELKNFKTTGTIDLVKIEYQINNYKKSMVANIVGVLKEIYQRLQRAYDGNVGWIIFEGLEDSDIAYCNKSEEDIRIPLREALIKNFQLVTKTTEGNDISYVNLTPPLALINNLSDKQKYSANGLKVLQKQFGVMKYVSPKESRQCCPKCGTQGNGYHYDDIHNNKFKCVNPLCNFDTENPQNNNFVENVIYDLGINPDSNLIKQIGFAECYIFVEGKYDILTFQHLLNIYNKTDKHKIAFIPMGGGDNVKMWIDWKLVKSLKRPYLFVIDSDNKSKSFDGLDSKNIHILKKREFENYIRPECLERISVLSLQPNSLQKYKAKWSSIDIPLIVFVEKNNITIPDNENINNETVANYAKNDTVFMNRLKSCQPTAKCTPKAVKQISDKMKSEINSYLFEKGNAVVSDLDFTYSDESGTLKDEFEEMYNKIDILCNQTDYCV